MAKTRVSQGLRVSRVSSLWLSGKAMECRYVFVVDVADWEIQVSVWYPAQNLLLSLFSLFAADPSDQAFAQEAAR